MNTDKTCNNADILHELKKPFHPAHVTWKPGAVTKDQTKALALAYADLRAYQNRLDEVCGMDWSVTYTPWGERIVCHLTINGITRSSSGEPDSQAERSEIAGTAAEAQAFKRACAMFGLGRYLYNLPSVWVEYDQNTKQFTDKAKAKLEGIIVQHYRRWLNDVDTTGQRTSAVESNPPVAAPSAPEVEEPTQPEPKAENKSTEQSAPTTVAETPKASKPEKVNDALDPLRQQFNQLGEELYGAQWEQVSRHNVERITAGKAADSGALSVEQIQKLVDGMRKLQRKRQSAMVLQENGHAMA